MIMAGAGITLVTYIIVGALYSPGPESAVPDISPVGDSNQHVSADGAASFTVTVPSRYAQLEVTFNVTDSGTAISGEANCINGSSLDITPSYEDATGQVQDIAPGMPDTIQIPPGISSLMLSIRFVPQLGYTHCDEQILVAAAQFSS